MSSRPRRRLTAAAILLLASSALLQAQAKKPLIAVLPFQAIDVSANTAQIIATLFETNLVNTNAYTVLSQNERQQILAAQEESLSDCTDEACAVQIGKLLASEQIIMGTVAALGKKLIINAKIIDVESSKTLAAGNISAASIEELDTACETLTITLVQKAQPQSAIATKPATEAPKTTTTAPATEAAKPAETPKTTTTTEPAKEQPAKEQPATKPATTPTAKPAPVRPAAQPGQPVTGINVAAIAIVSGGVLLTEVGWLAKSIGATVGVQAQDAWVAYRSATSNLDALYTQYETSHTTYTAATASAYGLWGVGPAATAAAIFLFQHQPLAESMGGRITFAAGMVTALAGNVLHAMAATYGSQAHDAYLSYSAATSNVDALYTAYNDAYGRYQIATIASYGLWAVGTLAVPVSFFLPGQRTAIAPNFAAKLMVAGGTLLAAVGNYAYGLAATAQTTAQAAWYDYSTATANLDALYGAYATAFGQYKIGSIAAYGLWAAGGLATAAAVLIPWGGAAAATSELRSDTTVAVSVTPAPTGLAFEWNIKL